MLELESRPVHVKLWSRLARHLTRRPRAERDRLARRASRNFVEPAVERLEERVVLSSSIPLNSVTWTPIGPADIAKGSTPGTLDVSGRVNSVATDPTNQNIIYVGTAGGGVWKTVDGGTTWAPLTDHQASLTIGAVAVAPSAPNIVYAGTGEFNLSYLTSQGGGVITLGGSTATGSINAPYDAYAGAGLLKSVDSGATWSLVRPDLFAGKAFSKIIVNPSNPSVVYAAVSGSSANLVNVLNGTPGNGGIWKSIDGGATWVNTTANSLVNSGTFPLPTDAAYSDVIFKANDPETLFAGVMNFRNSNGVYESTNGGSSWFFSSNFPTGPNVGRITLATTGQDPTASAAQNAANANIVYATIASAQNNTLSQTGHLYTMMKTTTGGAVWFNLPNVPDLFDTAGQTADGAGNYDNSLAVDPIDPKIIYAAGYDSDPNNNVSGFIRSVDGGTTWTSIETGSNGAGPHNRHHQIVFDVSGRIIDATDGGVFRLSNPASTTGGSLWSSINGNLNTFLANSVALDINSVSDVAYASGQGNGTVQFNNNLVWKQLFSGEGFVTLSDFSNPNRIYREGYSNGVNISVSRSDDGGVTWNAIDGNVFSGPNPRPTFIDNLIETRTLYEPMALNLSNSRVVYRGTDLLYESQDYGASWTPIGGAPRGGNGYSGISPGVGVDANGNISTGWQAGESIMAIGASTNTDVVYAGVRSGTWVGITGDNTGDVTRGAHLYVSTPFQPPINYPARLINLPYTQFKTWTDVFQNIPNQVGANNNLDRHISAIMVDPQDPKVVYVSFDDNTGPGHIFRSDNYGLVYATGPKSGQTSWIDLSGDLPANRAVVSMQIDKRQFDVQNDVVYIGTDAGVYYTHLTDLTALTAGQPHWIKVGVDPTTNIDSLPNVRVKQIVLDKTNNLLAVATYGRGVWEVNANAPPTLTAIANPVVTGPEWSNPAIPSQIPISYLMLKNASNAADPNGDNVVFQLDSVQTGTLTKNGVPVVPGSTRLEPTDNANWVWTPPLYDNNVLNGFALNNNIANSPAVPFNAFKVKAFDFELTSSTAVQVQINVTPVPNAPTLSVVPTLSTQKNTPLQIPFATFFPQTNAADVDDVPVPPVPVDPVTSIPLQFLVTSVDSGSLTIRGQAAVPGSTVFTLGDVLVWTPPLNFTGLNQPAFHVAAFDGALTSQSLGVKINVLVPPPTAAFSAVLSGQFGGTEDQPLAINFNNLVAASNAVDPTGLPISFVITAVNGGSLTLNGSPVVPGTSIFTSTDTLVWTPPLHASGTLPAFTVDAFNGQSLATNTTLVSVDTKFVDYPPTLTTIQPIYGGAGSPVTVSYAQLLSASDATDIENSAIFFRVQALISGTLVKNGLPVVPGQTLIGPGDTVVWTAPPGAQGLVAAWQVTAFDGTSDSLTAVTVSINLNVAPRLTTIATLPGGVTGLPYPISYSTLLPPTSDLFDPEQATETLSFIIQQVVNGTLTKNGVAVVPGVTVIGPGDTVVWTSGPTDTGVKTAFTVTAFDGTYQSGAPVPVNIDVGSQALVRLLRAYNPNAQYHFFTTSVAEFKNAVAHGYIDETTGRAGFDVTPVQYPNEAPLLRLRNPNTGRHYYTPNTGERDILVHIGWIFEKTEGYIYQSQVPGSSEIFKLYNVNSGTHLYTDSAAVRQAILTQFPGIWIPNTSLGFGFSVGPNTPIPGLTAAAQVARDTSAPAVDANVAASLASGATVATSGSSVSQTGASNGLATVSTNSTGSSAYTAPAAGGGTSGSSSASLLATPSTLDQLWGQVGQQLTLSGSTLDDLLSKRTRHTVASS